MNEELKSSEEDYKHYRQSGTGLSATVIALSLGIGTWLYKEKDSSRVALVSVTLLGTSIIAGLLIQFAHYKGYQAKARTAYGQSTKAMADIWFSRADNSVEWCLALFLGGSILAAIHRFISR